MSTAKNIDQVRFKAKDGTSYLLSVRAEPSWSGGPLNQFSIALPWGVRFADKNVDKLIAMVREEVDRNGSLPKTKVIVIEHNDRITSNFKEEGLEGALLLGYQVALKSIREDGATVYYSAATGKQIYLGGVEGECEWSEAAEYALKCAIAQLREISTRVLQLIKSPTLKTALEGSKYLLSLPPVSNDEVPQ